MNSLISQINDQSKLVICSAIAKDGKSFTSSQVKCTFRIHMMPSLMEIKGTLNTCLEMDDSQVWFMVSALWNCIGDESWWNCKSMENCLRNWIVNENIQGNYEIVNSYFLHNNVKSQALFMSSEIQINRYMEREGSILVNDDILNIIAKMFCQNGH